jgi:3-methyladenine DNA glycosylase AlkD
MELQKTFRKLGSPEIANHSQRFFKTGKGQYGYGDIFLGIRTPLIRKFVKDNLDINISDTKKFIRSKYHEERMLGLLILVNKYSKSKDEEEKEKIFNLYVSSFKYINNWDLVDVTSPHVVGKHLMDKDRSILYEWAKSEDLWTKRIAIVSNWWFIRNRDLKDVFKISKILLNDEHDLIHKAVGWMLREAGKKDLATTEVFMKKHYQQMPRTMLRYAIERYPEAKRQKYLRGKI